VFTSNDAPPDLKTNDLANLKLIEKITHLIYWNTNCLNAYYIKQQIWILGKYCSETIAWTIKEEYKNYKRL